MQNSQEMKKCYVCKWHTDKCKNRESKNFNKFPEEVKSCNEPIKYNYKLPSGITKEVNKTRKPHKCYFCGYEIKPGEKCLATVDFKEHDIKYSCMDCYKGILYLYGD